MNRQFHENHHHKCEIMSELNASHHESVMILADLNRPANNDDNTNNNHQNGDRNQLNPNDPKPTQFYIITSCYLLFTVTDSALRMIVMFELFQRNFNVIAIAVMFAWYEAVGMFTNVFGGLFGTSKGLKYSLILGLLNQLVAIGLFGVVLVTESWNRYAVIVYITLLQSFTGIAKDLVKLAGKSSAKLVKVLKSNRENDNIFKLVAWLTGAKNSVKGFGFFLGSLLIGYIGYWPSLLTLFLLILICLPLTTYLDNNLGKSSSKSRHAFQDIFKPQRSVNNLSLARFFLFGSRDVWFEIALPIFLRSVYGWPYLFAGTLLAIWVIFYGMIQSATPTLILSRLGQFPLRKGTILVPWSISLLVISFGMSLFMTLYTMTNVTQIAIFLTCLFLFGLVFAVNSSIHSFLIVAYSNKDKVAMTIGFYYMANAGGRLFGTLLSGFLYYYLGLSACLWASCIMLVATIIVSTTLEDVKEE